MAYKGIFKPKNKEKYAGDASQIIYRSLLERTFMKWLDENSNIIEWQSEEFCIPYLSPVDNRIHRYFPDFFVKHVTQDDKIQTTLIEVKPAKQCVAPKAPSTRKGRKRFLKEAKTWAVNNAKWEAAEKWAKSNDCVFSIITEKDIIGLTGKPIYKSKKRKKTTK